ncbi:hypothetical protein HU200_036074 [Digitaria exilis]|uniref:Uncharacterized protein n=1 Tax=Digitaria exilis TaxID=1010633 RepID=A0A835BMM0_9POAL|nr:hypothetical protein HU200_036074 [Digitaria exilis]
MAVLIPVASPRFVWIVERWRKLEDRQRQSGATRRADVQRDRPASSGPGARTCPNARLTSASVAMLVVLVCTLVMLVGQLIQVHAPAKDSYRDKFGSAISDMACLIATLVLCSFLLPGTVIQLLRHGCGVGYGRWQLNA